MPPRAIVLTGASGFIGRHFLEAVKGRCEVFAIARRSQRQCGAPVDPSIRWIQVDLTEEERTRGVFRKIAAEGRVDAVVHLAGYYDFTGLPSPQYRSVNVDATRSVLEGAHIVAAGRFVFASSIAACQFPPAGRFLDERSPPDGDTPYAESKREAERLVGSIASERQVIIARFGASFSDWCEYEPLFRFLETWLSPGTLHSILAGRGLSAVPYLHVLDACSFLERTLEVPPPEDGRRAEILLASPDGSTTHEDLYAAATAAHFGCRRTAVHLPRSLCWLGIRLKGVIGRAVGAPPFERPWMGGMIDRQLAVDARVSRARLGWTPRARLSMLRRIPFMVQNRKSHPIEWYRRNHAALRRERLHESLRIHRLLEENEELVLERFTRHWHEAGQPSPPGDPHRSLVESLMDAIRLGDLGVFTAAARSYAERCRVEGLSEQAIAQALAALGEISRAAVLPGGRDAAWETAVRDHVDMTIRFGIDVVHEVFEA